MKNSLYFPVNYSTLFSIWYIKRFIDCKKGHHAIFNSTEMVECVKCEVDTYQETDSRNTNCVNCPEGANTDGEIGSIECCMSSLTYFIFISWQ